MRLRETATILTDLLAIYWPALVLLALCGAAVVWAARTGSAPADAPPPSPPAHGNHRKDYTVPVTGVAPLPVPEHGMYQRAAKLLPDIIGRFYARVFADPTLAPYFTHLDQQHRDTLRQHQGLLFSQILGGPAAYTVDQISLCHKGVSSEAYWRAVFHLGVVLTEAHCPEDIVEHILVALNRVRPAIVDPSL